MPTLSPSHSPAHEKYPMVTLVTYMIGLFDPYGVDHSERVSKIAVTMGMYMGMQQADLEVLELAGLLHDIGKVGMPESIRLKPGGLTEAERFMMQQHPLMGLNIMKRMNGNIDKRVHFAIYHHHENWDGSGYPAGLKGSEIPLEARIIRIPDTYDAITHSRGYRLPATHKEAIAIMERDQGTATLFDPALFANFLRMMRGGAS